MTTARLTGIEARALDACAALPVAVASAQPANRSDLKYPDGMAAKVRTVVVQARDGKYGYGGMTVEVAPSRQ